MNSKRTVPVTVTIAIIAMFFVMGHYSAVNSIIQKMIEAFPDASVSTVRLASTLPSLFGLIFGLIFGAIAGKKIKFKPLMLLSLCLIGVGGILPLWWNSKIAYVLIARAIQGIGVGASMPANAIVIRVYPADIRILSECLYYGVFTSAAAYYQDIHFEKLPLPQLLIFQICFQ